MIMAGKGTFKEYCESLKKKYASNDKVLFVQIPQFILKSFDPAIAKRKGYYAFPPTGLQYLSESLKDSSLNINILDLNLEVLKKATQEESFDPDGWMDILEDELDRVDPYIVGVSCMYDSGIPVLMKILELLKKRDRSIVVVGGVIGTYEHENLLSRDLCHFVVKGEGEGKVNYLFDQLTKDDTGVQEVPGICFSNGSDILETSGEMEKASFDTDLVDSYSLIDISDYHKYGSLNPFSRKAEKRNAPYAAIQLSRGCRGNCTFCSVGDFMGKGIRSRSVSKVLSEMEFLVEKCGIKHFEWLDDDLLFFKEEVTEILQTVVDKGWDISWSANNGLIATSLDDEILGLMRDSGCEGFKIGVETGNPEMLKKVRKPATLDAFRKVARVISGYPEIFVGANFMIGFPEEKFGQMMDSFLFYIELDMDWAAFTMCQAIRGATAFDDFEDHFADQIELGGDKIKNFIPTRDTSKGEFESSMPIAKGMDIFNIDSDTVPSEEQMKEIWFTFNLVGNFINNKNLRSGGNVDKFISWVEMAQEAYPVNPYMSLFLAIAYLIKGDATRTREYYDKASNSCQGEYWKDRMAFFGLDEVLNDFPGTKEEAMNAGERLREKNSVSGKMAKVRPTA
ncbi:B12-binding domain-containing radical SAM protein [Candidatus Omnitrophota bacterium]